jgi:hypothetical protein
VGFWDNWVEVAQRLCLRGRKRFWDNVVLLWVMYFAGISVGFVALFNYQIQIHVILLEEFIIS